MLALTGELRKIAEEANKNLISEEGLKIKKNKESLLKYLVENKVYKACEYFCRTRNIDETIDYLLQLENEWLYGYYGYMGRYKGFLDRREAMKEFNNFMLYNFNTLSNDELYIKINPLTFEYKTFVGEDLEIIDKLLKISISKEKEEERKKIRKLTKELEDNANLSLLDDIKKTIKNQLKNIKIFKED